MAIIIYWIFKPPFNEWALVYFMSGFIAVFIAVILVEHERFEFPIRFLSAYFSTSLLYEYLVLPISCVLFNKTSYFSSFKRSFVIACVYSIALTVAELILLLQTELIIYHNWTLLHTFVSLILFLLASKYLRLLFQIRN